MEEYASIRLILDCARASRLPTVMLRTANTAAIIVQDPAKSGKATAKSRRNTAKPAAFDAVERKPAIGVGAPVYTSGAQKWNGTADILKPSPTTIRKITPRISTGVFAPDTIIP